MNGVSLKAEVSPLVCMEPDQDAGYFWFQDHLPKLLGALLAWNQSPHNGLRVFQSSRDPTITSVISKRLSSSLWNSMKCSGALGLIDWAQSTTEGQLILCNGT